MVLVKKLNIENFKKVGLDHQEGLKFKKKRILHKFNDKSELEDMYFEKLQKPIVSGRSGWLTQSTSI
jgi:hypothetical protein